LFQILDDLLVLFLFLETSFEGSLHVFLLLYLLKAFDVDHRLVGKTNLFAPVSKQ